MLGRHLGVRLPRGHLGGRERAARRGSTLRRPRTPRPGPTWSGWRAWWTSRDCRRAPSSSRRSSGSCATGERAPSPAAGSRASPALNRRSWRQTGSRTVLGPRGAPQVPLPASASDGGRGGSTSRIQAAWTPKNSTRLTRIASTWMPLSDRPRSAGDRGHQRKEGDEQVHGQHDPTDDRRQARHVVLLHERPPEQERANARRTRPASVNTARQTSGSSGAIDRQDGHHARQQEMERHRVRQQAASRATAATRCAMMTTTQPRPRSVNEMPATTA